MLPTICPSALLTTFIGTSIKLFRVIENTAQAVGQPGIHFDILFI